MTKKMRGWDAYVQESLSKDDRTVELPLTEDECYTINFPTRKQGRKIADAQEAGDVEALLEALLGEEAGRRVAELSEDQPGYVLDNFILDLMKKLGVLPDDEDEEPDQESEAVPAKGKSSKPRTNSKAA